MKGKISGSISLITAMFVLLFLGACGNSGGGGNDGLTYEGKTSQATVTDENADDLASEAYEGGDAGSSIGGGIGVVQKEGKGVSTSQAVRLSVVLENALKETGISSAGINAGATQSGTEYGQCGGKAVYTITADQSGKFSGKMEFKSYCEDGTIMSGKVRFTGLVDTVTDELLKFRFSFDLITVTDGSGSFSADGFVSVDVTSMPKTVSMDLLMRDNITGHMVWINNYSLSVNEGSDAGGNFEEVSFSGRFYDSIEGFVDISTPSPIKCYEFDDHPTSGELRIDGAGSTYALLQFIDKDHFQVLAETDGNAATFPDWDSGVIDWSSL